MKATWKRDRNREGMYCNIEAWIMRFDIGNIRIRRNADGMCYVDVFGHETRYTATIEEAKANAMSRAEALLRDALDKLKEEKE
jgi:hypothetical protein